MSKKILMTVEIGSRYEKIPDSDAGKEIPIMNDLNVIEQLILESLVELEKKKWISFNQVINKEAVAKQIFTKVMSVKFVELLHFLNKL